MDGNGSEDVQIIERKRKFVVIDLTLDEDADGNDNAVQSTKKLCSTPHQVIDIANGSENVEEDDEYKVMCVRCGCTEDTTETMRQCDCGLADDCFNKIDDKCGYCEYCSDTFTCHDCCDGGHCYKGGYDMCSLCAYNHPERCGC